MVGAKIFFGRHRDSGRDEVYVCADVLLARLPGPGGRRAQDRHQEHREDGGGDVPRPRHERGRPADRGDLGILFCINTFVN